MTVDPEGGERSVDRRHTRRRALCTWCCGRRQQHVGVIGWNVVVTVVVVVVVVVLGFATAAAAAVKIVVVARVEAQDVKRTDAAMLRIARRVTGFVR